MRNPLNALKDLLIPTSLGARDYLDHRADRRDRQMKEVSNRTERLKDLLEIRNRRSNP